MRFIKWLSDLFAPLPRSGSPGAVVWVNFYEDGGATWHHTKEQADAAMGVFRHGEAVMVRR